MTIRLTANPNTTTQSTTATHNGSLASGSCRNGPGPPAICENKLLGSQGENWGQNFETTNSGKVKRKETKPMIGVDFNLDAISSATAVIPGAMRQIAIAPRRKIVDRIGVSVMRAIVAKITSELRVTAVAV